MRPYYTLDQIRRGLLSGELAFDELIRSYWLRAASNGVAPDGDAAWLYLASEQQLEAQIAVLREQSPEDLPLYAVPFAVKDNIDVAGWPTSAACPSFTHIATETATVVTQLLDAGAVLIGKTNMDQFATGLVGTRSPFGAVPNTFCAAHVSGGSSSGSASVLARGLVSFALGTDTAGSGRIPAGFNNVVGLKPTPGVLSTEGVVPAVRSVDCVSIFALTVADAQTVLHQLQDPQIRSREPVFHPTATPRFQFPEPIRVGVPDKAMFVSDHYRTQFDEALVFAKSSSASLAEFDMSVLSEVASLLYDGPWIAERLIAAGPSIDAGAPDLDPVVGKLIGRGREFSALDACSAQYRVRELAARIAPWWSRFDVLMVPTAPNLPSLDDLADEPVLRNSELGFYTNFVNLLGWAALAVPFSIGSDGLPFGVTFIGPAGSDEALLRLGHRWQAARQLPLGCRLQPYEAPALLGAPSATTSIALAVVGAHLEGMPLHHQVVSAGASLRRRTRTAPRYRLYALDGSMPPKPGLARQSQGGESIEVEVYDFPIERIGQFIAQVPPPLGIGSLELSDGQWVKGFICEAWALEQAVDITQFGGWRAYVAAQQ